MRHNRIFLCKSETTKYHQTYSKGNFPAARSSIRPRSVSAPVCPLSTLSKCPSLSQLPSKPAGAPLMRLALPAFSLLHSTRCCSSPSCMPCCTDWWQSNRAFAARNNKYWGICVYLGCMERTQVGHHPGHSCKLCSPLWHLFSERWGEWQEAYLLSRCLKQKPNRKPTTY